MQYLYGLWDHWRCKVVAFPAKEAYVQNSMSGGDSTPTVTCKYCGCLLHLTLAMDTCAGCVIKAYKKIPTKQSAWASTLALTLKKLIVLWIHSRKITNLKKHY